MRYGVDRPEGSKGARKWQEVDIEALRAVATLRVNTERRTLRLQSASPRARVEAPGVAIAAQSAVALSPKSTVREARTPQLEKSEVGAR